MAIDDSKKAKSLADLGKLIGTQPSKQAASGPKAGAAPLSAAKRRLLSCEVSRADRAGRASYGHVPLPDSVFWLPDPPPPHDIYDAELLNGEINIELSAATDFFIRGLRSLEDYQRNPEGKQDNPFVVNGRLQLPGSSLRGMIRSMVEILGRAPLDPVNDQQHFFRAVAAVPDPRNHTSFEPQAKAYKSRAVSADQVRDPKAPRVMVGYLYGGRDHWTIRPAEFHSSGRQWFLVREGRTWLRVNKYQFMPEPPPRSGEPAKFARPARVGEPGAITGTLVCSGPMQKKTHQWAIMPEGRGAKPIDIPEVDVAAYLESGFTPDFQRQHPDFVYTRQSKGVPCFYVQWTDNRGRQRVSFGHTHYFRLPYVNSTIDAIPTDLRRQQGDARWDLAQALFGRVPRKDGAAVVPGAKGRVSVEDGIAIPDSGPTESYAARPEKVVLGQPKPTTFQHYLVQPTDAVADSICWDGNHEGKGSVIVRGFKVYWHRPGAPLRTGETKDKVSTEIRPARAGARFASKLRFHNLREWELGALLAALDLPDGCAHRLGMGKPLGLGSFRVQVRSVVLFNRQARYSAFLLSTPESGTAATLATGADVEPNWHRFKDAFARTVAEPAETIASMAEYWKTPRLSQLAALLKLDGLPPQWIDMTRSLQFGQVELPGGRTQNYNEYLSVGLHERNPRLSKRRPLPNPTQVVAAGKAIPNDPLPRFLPPKNRQSR